MMNNKQAKLDLYQVRLARADDFETVFAFMRESFQFLPFADKALLDLRSTCFASAQAFAQTYLPSDDGRVNTFYLVEELASNQAIACVGGKAINPFEVELIHLFVSSAHRRQGLAAMLVDKIVQFAQTNGFERVVLQCGYPTAMEMYKHCGFIQCGKYFFWQRVAGNTPLERVVVLGGVHGNELIGIHLIQERWARRKEHKRMETLVCNLLAQERCVRFVDKDLNRCFALADLDNLNNEFKSTREMQRAWEINKIIGPKQDIPGSIRTWREKNPGACDYVIDLHSTTSNMGLTLITLKGNAMTVRLASFLQRQLAAAHCPIPFYLMVDSDCARDVNNNIDSVPPSGFCLEVGPLAHGTLNDAALLEWTAHCVEQSLDFIQAFNQDSEPRAAAATEEEMDGFELFKPVYFPRNEENGCLLAMLHPSRVGRDFQPLNKGDALFVDIATGKQVTYYEEEETVYPCFLGEAAYFTQGIACWLCRKRAFPLYG